MNYLYIGDCVEFVNKRSELYQDLRKKTFYVKVIENLTESNIKNRIGNVVIGNHPTAEDWGKDGNTHMARVFETDLIKKHQESTLFNNLESK